MGPSTPQPQASGPIQNLDVLDILGVRKDGGIDAVIVAAIAIDGTAETLVALAAKIRNYLAELTSESFLEEHPREPGAPFRIVIAAHGKVDPLAVSLVKSLRAETERRQIMLEIEYQEPE